MVLLQAIKIALHQGLCKANSYSGAAAAWERLPLLRPEPMAA